MISEHFKKIKATELIFLLIVSIISSGLIFLANFIFPESIILISSVIFMVIGMNVLVYITKKFRIATLFFCFHRNINFPPKWHRSKWLEKIFTFLFAGLIFEVVFLILKLKLHCLPLNLIISTNISATSIPLITAFLISSSLASSFPTALINLMLLGFTAGLGSSIIVFLLWYNLEKTKTIILLKSYLKHLTDTKETK